MDPTFRRHLLDYLESDDVQQVIGEDAQEKLIAQIGGVEVHPHLVHVKGAIEERPDVDDAGKPIKLNGIAQRTRTYHGPVSCPDCGGGLTNRGHDMICALLPAQTTERGCHEGCLVACGRV